MADAERQIGFEQIGIGKILRNHWLQVPLNQREYSWTRREVTSLFYDLNHAITADASEYFLEASLPFLAPRATSKLWTDSNGWPLP